MKALKPVALVLTLVGALNWGLVAFGFNLVNILLGTVPLLEKLVYVLVGASAVYLLVTDKKLLGK